MRFPCHALFIIVLGLTIGCTEEPEPVGPIESCENLINNFDAALTVYNSDPTNRGKCIQVKEVGALLLDCPGLSPSEKNDYKNTIDAIYCN